MLGRKARKIASYYSGFPGVFLPNSQNDFSKYQSLMGKHEIIKKSEK
jgi:hypothetical protein